METYESGYFSIAIGYGLNLPGSIPAVSFHSVQADSGAQSASYQMGSGVKRPVREAKYWSQSSAEIKNHETCLHDTVLS